MTQRNVALVIVLTLITCGLYSFYWHYVVTEELKRTSGKTDLSPGLDLLLAIVTCGIWYVYVDYRNAQLSHSLFAARGPHEDKSTLVLLLDIGTYFTGFTGIVAMAILQDEFNKMVGLPTAVGP